MKAVVHVHAQFPNGPPPSAPDCTWKRILSFPVDKLRGLRFSHKPYKWMRYATGVVVGAEGDFSSSEHNILNFNYDGDLPSSPIKIYYHVTNATGARMFPLDPELANTRAVTTTGRSIRRANFRTNVKQRDGHHCVLSRLHERYCEACHMLGYDKGDDYIRTFTTHRQRDPSDVIEDIDSVRNGMFLNKYSHGALGQDVAILVTPNFAMNTEDVVQVGSAIRRQRGKRFTAHLFVAEETLLLGGPNASSGSEIRVPHSNSRWPPDILFEAVYGSAVVRHFGKDLKKILAPWRDVFYPPQGPVTAPLADQLLQHSQNTERSLRITENNSLRDIRARSRGDRESGDMLDGFDVIMFLPYMCMSPEKVIKDRRERQEEMTAKEREAREAKVNSWFEEVPLST